VSERSPAGPVAAEARSRIIDAGARCIARDSVSGASMAAIALEAGVSKALLHYHYHDRATLLTEIVEHVGARVIERERATIDTVADASGLDALWNWLDAELRRGDLACLGALSLVSDGHVRSASRAVANRRREAATRTVERLFDQLGLTPRVPAALLAEASVAFLDGLTLDVASGTTRDPRVSFDVFWLGLLGLAE
jgi:TetR/AcrR family transcriptional repressor of nem operon